MDLTGERMSNKVMKCACCDVKTSEYSSMRWTMVKFNTNDHPPHLICNKCYKNNIHYLRNCANTYQQRR